MEWVEKQKTKQVCLYPSHLHALLFASHRQDVTNAGSKPAGEPVSGFSLHLEAC